MTTFYIGLDLGSTFCYQCVMKPDGSIFRSRPVPTSEQSLRSAFEGFDGDLLVHTEAGELAFWADVIKPVVNCGDCADSASQDTRHQRLRSVKSLFKF